MRQASAQASGVAGLGTTTSSRSPSLDKIVLELFKRLHITLLGLRRRFRTSRGAIISLRHDKNYNDRDNCDETCDPQNINLLHFIER
jgi:hypothetical protein